MFSVLWKIRGLSVLVVVLAVGALGCGTDPEEACDIVCSKNAECQTGSAKETCLAACKEQVKEESYADAIVVQSECYEDASCADLAANKCVPQDL